MPQRIGTESNNFTATIAISQTVSNTIDCRRDQLLAIHMPAAFTGTSITFQASVDGVTFNTVREVGGSATYTLTNVAASQFIPLNVQVFAAAQYVRIVSGSSEAAARSIICVLRPIS